MSGLASPLAALAQQAATETGTVLAPLRATASAPPPPPSIAGFGDKPLALLPLQAAVIGRSQIDEIGARDLSDLISLDAATSDAYNAAGYWSSLTVRGFVIDQRFNYRREGLPISAETVIPLENKERVEVLKGTSGLQSGTSAPGGLVNFVVKRPTAQPLRSVTLNTGEYGTFGAAADISDRAGTDGAVGYRFNVTSEERDPAIRQYGHLQRKLFAAAADWRVSSDSLWQAELEWSRQVGASVPPYSLLGNSIPAVRRPGNINNQPWSAPNDFNALTGTLRFDHRLASGWRWITDAGVQRLKTNDRLAYPYGCSQPGEAGDRYCPDGTYDLYDYRSENEQRRLESAQTALQGELRTGAITHSLRAGVLLSRTRNSFQDQAYNPVGSGNIDGTLVQLANPTPTSPTTNRREHTIETFVQDAIDWGHGWSTWLGLRQTHLRRSSIRTDGASPSEYSQDLTTPWLALAYEWKPQQQLYISWGEGMESAVVPNLPVYGTEAGRALPALKSRQWEIGAKGSSDHTDWSLAYFRIERPAVSDTTTAFVIDGTAEHQGVEGQLTWTQGAWQWNASAMALHAERQGSADASLNGKRPVNVPDLTLRLRTRYRVASLPGLDLQAGISHEGRRSVLEDESIELPSWTRTDIGMVYRQHAATAGHLTWRLGIDNLFDRRAWKESPRQYGHVYLFPLEARTLRLSLRIDI